MNTTCPNQHREPLNIEFLMWFCNLLEFFCSININKQLVLIFLNLIQYDFYYYNTAVGNKFSQEFFMKFPTINAKLNVYGESLIYYKA